jgi:hypothetical protein
MCSRGFAYGPDARTTLGGSCTRFPNSSMLHPPFRYKPSNQPPVNRRVKTSLGPLPHAREARLRRILHTDWSQTELRTILHSLSEVDLVTLCTRSDVFSPDRREDLYTTILNRGRELAENGAAWNPLLDVLTTLDFNELRRPYLGRDDLLRAWCAIDIWIEEYASSWKDIRDLFRFRCLRVQDRALTVTFPAGAAEVRFVVRFAPDRLSELVTTGLLTARGEQAAKRAILERLGIGRSPMSPSLAPDPPSSWIAAMRDLAFAGVVTRNELDEIASLAAASSIGVDAPSLARLRFARFVLLDWNSGATSKQIERIASRLLAEPDDRVFLTLLKQHRATSAKLREQIAAGGTWQ